MEIGPRVTWGFIFDRAAKSSNKVAQSFAHANQVQLDFSMAHTALFLFEPGFQIRQQPQQLQCKAGYHTTPCASHYAWRASYARTAHLMMMQQSGEHQASLWSAVGDENPVVVASRLDEIEG